MPRGRGAGHRGSDVGLSPTPLLLPIAAPGGLGRYGRPVERECQCSCSTRAQDRLPVSKPTFAEWAARRNLNPIERPEGIRNTDNLSGRRSMRFRFRLTFHHGMRGFFRFESASETFSIDDGLQLTLAARDADTLSQASRFHLEGRGFPDQETARSVGERLRLRLRVLNSLLDLRITVPTIDTTSTTFSDQTKEKILRDTGCILLDSIVGLNVFPDDDNYLECAVAGTANVYPSDPSFLFEALARIWSTEMEFDQRAEDALEILSHATTETSPRAKFLMTYLAAERVVDRGGRSKAAKALIEEFRERVRCAKLEPREAASLQGALARLHEKSFRSSLFELADKISDPIEVAGMPLRQFLSRCVNTRKCIVHNYGTIPDTDLRELSDGLRHFVMKVIWTITTFRLFPLSYPPPLFRSR